MDRNSVIGLVLIAVILVVFSILNAPTEAEMKAQQQKEDSLRNVQKKEIEEKQKKADKKKTAEVVDINSVKSNINQKSSNKIIILILAVLFICVRIYVCACENFCMCVCVYVCVCV